ncbi:nucleotidyltransferase family protein [Salinisphaera aquimarina]|uniref:NTP transferase domain-containing protein n=1 Tax=Salinisphaera aquimarina TaxID=2094031 RepID=A0ABV7ERC6_9GAMM
MIGAVVLAAGRSERYGYISKMLASFDGAPLVAQTLATLDAAGLRRIVLVTGPRHATIARIARCRARPSSRLRIVRHRRYRDGMATSLQQGLIALPSRTDAALICLADMPGMSVDHIQRLCAQWHAGLDYLRPVHAGVPGHPVLVSRRLFASIGALTGDRGAQAVLSRVPDARRRLVPARQDSVVDIDTPRALRRALRRLH